MVDFPELDVVKESLKVENQSLKVVSVSLVAILVLMILTRGKKYESD